MERLSAIEVYTSWSYREDRFHLPRCGRRPGDLHGPVLMHQWYHSPVGTSCPRVGIGV